MFYVYRIDHYAEYEPAEGGYYVDCWDVTDVETFDSYSFEDACDALLEWCNEVETEDCATFCRGSWKFGFNRHGYIQLPHFVYDETGNIGDGFELGISVERPKEKRYYGYC